MSIENFIDNLDISLKDLEYSSKNGYVAGQNNILKMLANLEPIERPIHCTDKKRLNFYVKNADKWEKDVNNQKINRAINFIESKQVSQIKEWEEENPNYSNDPILKAKWYNLIQNTVNFPPAILFIKEDNPKLSLLVKPYKL